MWAIHSLEASQYSRHAPVPRPRRGREGDVILVLKSFFFPEL
jgi:hypothetical protein